MKLRLSLLTLMFLLVISACAPLAELRNVKFLNDDSLISGEPCEAPCWNDIIPGETAWNDAIIMLEDNTNLSNVKEETNESTTARIVTFQPKDGETCCLVYSEDGTTVDQILLQLAPNITLADILHRYGNPAYVTPIEIEGDPNQASVTFYYPEKNLLLYVFSAGKETGELSETSEIFAVLYAHKTIMDEILANSALYAWNGYDTFQNYLEAVPVSTPEVTPEPTN